LGKKDAKPLFHFHGFPGSRLEATVLSELDIDKLNVRIIGIDRPGMGISDFQEGRTLLDWPDDVVELADFLGIDKFIAEGISGGGPYAAACAFKIPERLHSCGIISGLAPKNLETEKRIGMFTMIRVFPWLFWLMMWFQARSFKDLETAEKSLVKIEKKLPEADKEILRNPTFRSSFIEDSIESFRQGFKGVYQEGKIYSKSWDFNIGDISPNLKVCLWHGEADLNVPVSMGYAMCKAIPNCTGKFYPEEGHFSVVFNYFEEIITSLTT